jgi:hypothetical protein
MTVPQCASSTARAVVGCTFPPPRCSLRCHAIAPAGRGNFARIFIVQHAGRASREHRLSAEHECATWTTAEPSRRQMLLAAAASVMAVTSAGGVNFLN